MSFFFRHLTLMFVLLRGLSADDGVSLNCNRTVEVTYGENLTLICDIKWKQNNCQHEIYSIKWIHTTENLCDKNTSCFDKTSASLQMFNVIEEKNIRVSISTDCGTDLVSISLKIKPVTAEVVSSTANPKPLNAIAAVSAVIIAVIAGVALHRRKQKQHQGVPQTDRQIDSVLTAV